MWSHDIADERRHLGRCELERPELLAPSAEPDRRPAGRTKDFASWTTRIANIWGIVGSMQRATQGDKRP